MLLKKDESGRKSRKVDELAGFELLILTGIISLILAGNYIAGYIHWRKHLGEHSIISNILEYRKGIEENLKAGIVQYIFDIEPVNTPKFLNEI